MKISIWKHYIVPKKHKYKFINITWLLLHYAKKIWKKRHKTLHCAKDNNISEKKVYEYHFVLLVTYKHLSEKFSNEIIIFH